MPENWKIYWLCNRFKISQVHETKSKMGVKEARNSFSFYQKNKHIVHLDTVRVITSTRNLARVLSTHRRFLTLYFPPKIPGNSFTCVLDLSTKRC